MFQLARRHFSKLDTLVYREEKPKGKQPVRLSEHSRMLWSGAADRRDIPKPATPYVHMKT
jgi:hypothetical protein